jgi:hypothetical protein
MLLNEDKESAKKAIQVSFVTDSGLNDCQPEFISKIVKICAFFLLTLPVNHNHSKPAEKTLKYYGGVQKTFCP